MLTTLLPALYWLTRVYREAGQRRVPSVAWWAAAGWTLVPFAGMLAQPTFFALGAAALLLAEFWPRAYKEAAARPSALWPSFGAGLGLALLLVTWQQWSETPQLPALAASLAALLAGVGGLMSVWGWRWAVLSPQLVMQWPRLARVTVPERPDLSLSLTGQGAQLQNVSPHTLKLLGWSPARLNAWLPFRDAAGKRIGSFETQQSAFLPLGEYDRGLRVWYSLPGEAAEPRLFRADWQPPPRDRVLN